jgi:hypothetical protein
MCLTGDCAGILGIPGRRVEIGAADSSGRRESTFGLSGAEVTTAAKATIVGLHLIVGIAYVAALQVVRTSPLRRGVVVAHGADHVAGGIA